MKLLKMLGEKHRQNAHRTIANYFAVVLLVIGFGFSAQSWAYDCSPPSQTDIPKEECEALLTFMETVDLVSGDNTGGGSVIADGLKKDFNWTNGSPCTKPELDALGQETGYFTGWDGVYCKNGHVERIGLNGDSNSHLKLKEGKTLPDFCKTPKSINDYSTLPHLWLLDLSGNNFNETSIPDFCLSEMKHLYLTNSNLSGTIKFTMKEDTDSKPELKLMPKLHTLKLESNNLVGNIPKLNSQQDSLVLPVVLHVDDNKLTGIEHYPLWTYSSKNCSPSNSLDVPPNFESPQKTADECKVTIKGFVFHDIVFDKQYEFDKDKKIAFYNQLVISNGKESRTIQADEYGNFIVKDIEETGNLQIINYNSLGWKQTAPLNSTTETPATGAYQLNLANNSAIDYSNVAIGVAVGTAEPPVSGIEIQHAPVTLGCIVFKL